MRTAIVGNGIVALTAALRLAQRGDEVVIIGDPARTGSATLAAAAMLSAFGELHEAALAGDRDRAKLELGIAATAQWARLGAELGGLAALGFGAGTYVVAEAEDPELDALLATLAEYREPHALIAPADVPGFTATAARALRIDREGWIDPRRVMQALERALRVQVIGATAVRVHATGAVEIADGTTIESDHTLLANGAGLTALLAASALPLRVQPVLYGVGTTLELRASQLACVRGRGVYSVPRGDRVVVGSTNLVAATPVDDPTAAARVLAAASRQLDRGFEGAELVRTNVGWRPTSLDGYPLVGRTSISRISIASGTRRDGFHLAPIIADHLAAVIHDERGDARFAAFAPERDPS